MDNSSMALIIGIIAVFTGASLVYFFLMVFFPEWVGITGKVALDVEAGHQDGSQVVDDFAFNEANRPRPDSKR